MGYGHVPTRRADDGDHRWPAIAGPPTRSRAYSSYCGNYTFDGTRLITRVDAASDPARIGSDQVREVSFDGDRMILRPPPRQGEAGEEYRELTWERIAAE